jgi:hypothetical protein
MGVSGSGQLEEEIHPFFKKKMNQGTGSRERTKERTRQQTQTGTTGTGTKAKAAPKAKPAPKVKPVKTKKIKTKTGSPFKWLGKAMRSVATGTATVAKKVVEPLRHIEIKFEPLVTLSEKAKRNLRNARNFAIGGAVVVVGVVAGVKYNNARKASVLKKAKMEAAIRVLSPLLKKDYNIDYKSGSDPALEALAAKNSTNASLLVDAIHAKKGMPLSKEKWIEANKDTKQADSVEAVAYETVVKQMMRDKSAAPISSGGGIPIVMPLVNGDSTHSPNGYFGAHRQGHSHAGWDLLAHNSLTVLVLANSKLVGNKYDDAYHNGYITGDMGNGYGWRAFHTKLLPMKSPENIRKNKELIDQGKEPLHLYEKFEELTMGDYLTDLATNHAEGMGNSGTDELHLHFEVGKISVNGFNDIAFKAINPATLIDKHWTMLSPAMRSMVVALYDTYARAEVLAHPDKFVPDVMKEGARKAIARDVAIANRKKAAEERVGPQSLLRQTLRRVKTANTVIDNIGEKIVTKRTDFLGKKYDELSGVTDEALAFLDIETELTVPASNNASTIKESSSKKEAVKETYYEKLPPKTLGLLAKNPVTILMAKKDHRDIKDVVTMMMNLAQVEGGQKMNITSRYSSADNPWQVTKGNITDWEKTTRLKYVKGNNDKALNSYVNVSLFVANETKNALTDRDNKFYEKHGEHFIGPDKVYQLRDGSYKAVDLLAATAFAWQGADAACDSLENAVLTTKKGEIPFLNCYLKTEHIDKKTGKRVTLVQDFMDQLKAAPSSREGYANEQDAAQYATQKALMGQHKIDAKRKQDSLLQQQHTIDSLNHVQTVDSTRTGTIPAAPADSTAAPDVTSTIGNRQTLMQDWVESRPETTVPPVRKIKVARRPQLV